MADDTFPNSRIAPNGHLIVQTKDGAKDMGRVVGRDGADGADGLGLVRLSTLAPDDPRNQEIYAHFNDGTSSMVGVLPKGDKGEKGETGEKGDPGQETDLGPISSELATVSQLASDTDFTVGEHTQALGMIQTRVQGFDGQLSDFDSRIRNVPNKTEAQMAASGALADAIATKSAADGSTAFTASGTVASRSVKDRFAEVANLRDYKLPGELHYNEAMTRAIQSGLPIEIPYSTSPYTFTLGFALPTGAVIYGKGGRPTLKPSGSSSRLFTATGASNVVLRDFIIDGSTSGLSFLNAILFNSSTDCLVQRVRLQSNRRGFRIENGSSRITLDQWECRNIEQHSVEIDGATTHGNTIQNGSTHEGLGFGIYLGNGTYQNLIQGNRGTTSTGNSLELVGLTHACHENKIIGNHVENVNDTGISITGYLNTVTGNTCLNCQGNGIHIYGERNTVFGNILRNNSRGFAVNALWRAGIAIQAGFGGTGQFNNVEGNICDDDQATPTQQYGIWIGPHSYETWSQKTWAAERYVTYAGNIYWTQYGGTSGTTPPTHTSGTVGDGGVAWTFIRTPLLGNSLAPTRNEIVGNNIIRAALSPYGDTGNGTGNEFIGGFTPALSVDPLVTSRITNSGGVGSLSAPGGGSGSGTGYNWPSSVLNGQLPKVIIAAPTGGGSTATAEVTSLLMLGFGTVSPIGSGYAVGDMLTITGGTPVVSATNLAAGSPRQIRVAAVDANGGITAIDSTGTTGTYYYTAPWLDGATLTGGGGAGAKLTATAWRVGQPPTVTTSGSGYTAAPAVTFNPKFGGAGETTVTLNAQVSLAAGAGCLVVSTTGTHLGVANTNAPVRTMSPSANGTVVRWLPTGSTYSVPVGCDLVRFTNTAAYGTAVTIALPSAPADGQFMQFTTGAYVMNSVNFTPAVLGWSTSSIAAYTSVRMRWDATAASWMRE